MLLSWRASLSRPGQRETNRMGDRYSLWVRSGFPGPLRATHRWRCVPFLFATGCCVLVRSSISVFFWLRMPGHGGAGSWSRTGRFCVPWAGRTRAVAPCRLCEELAVILVLGGWVWRLRSPLRGYCFGTLVPWFLAPFYRVCGGGAGPGLPGPARLDRSPLQSWCPVLGTGFLVCRLPSVSLPWVGSVGGFVYVSTF